MSAWFKSAKTIFVIVLFAYIQGVRQSSWILTPNFFLTWIEIWSSYLVRWRYGWLGLITCIKHWDMQQCKSKNTWVSLNHLKIQFLENLQIARQNAKLSNVNWYKFIRNEKNNGGIKFGNIMRVFLGSPRIWKMFPGNAMKLSPRIDRNWNRHFLILWFAPLCSQPFGYQTPIYMHVIKPNHPYFQHTKYDVDISIHVRKMWGAKIQLDCRTPCSNIWGMLWKHS